MDSLTEEQLGRLGWRGKARDDDWRRGERVRRPVDGSGVTMGSEAQTMDAKDVAEYLDKMADKARSRTPAPPSDATPLRDDDSAGRRSVQAEQGYRRPDPEIEPHGDRSDEDQGT